MLMYSIRKLKCSRRLMLDFRLPPRSIWELSSSGYYAASSGNFYSLRNNPEERNSRRSISILVRFAARYPVLEWPAVLSTQFLIKWVLLTICWERGGRGLVAVKWLRVKADHPPDLVPRSTVSEAARPVPRRPSCPAQRQLDFVLKLI